MSSLASDANLLPAIARASVAEHLTGAPPPTPPEIRDYLARRAGVFVTIRTRQGELRGCRGTIEPQFPDVAEETRRLALSSAFQDNRFAPVHREELNNLRFEVSVLHPPEPATGLEGFDPARHGIIVSTPDGRRALMLPGVEGLETAQKQFEATCRKGGIDPRESVTLERFVVDRFKEAVP
jgi:AmmeMemoRadiSam system protein A